MRIGIPEEYGHAILSRALSAFSKRHAKVEVTVRYAHSGAQIEAVETGELDLAVVFEWQGHSGGEVLMHDPTVWVTSELHAAHERRPLPIALYNRDGWCRDYAIRSLEERGLVYRVAYTCDTNGGLRLAVTSGLAIAPISRSNIPAGCRQLTEEEGFGHVDASNVVLHRNPLATGEACLVFSYSGDILQAKDGAKTGVDVHYSVPKEGALLLMYSMVVPKYAPNPDAAFAFINYIQKPEVIAKATNFVKYPNGNLESQKYVDPAILKDPTIYPVPETMAHLYTTTPNSEDVQDKLTDLWQKVLAGQ